MRRKTPEQLRREADALERGVRELGLPDSSLDPVLRALDDLRRGVGFSGTLDLPDTGGLALVVKLSVQPHIYSDVRLTRR
jgi:hypothetical protein